MTPFPILDLVAGMIFLYFLMSIISNSVIEGLITIFRLKSSLLTEWIKATLPDLSRFFTNHNLLDGLNKSGTTASYISSANFAVVLIDAIAKEAGKLPISLDNIEASMDDLEQKGNSKLPADLARIFRIFIAEAREKAKLLNQTKTELELFRHSIEVWFDSMMDRVGERFKKWVSLWTFIISTIVTLCLNVDSLQIGKYLYANEEARKQWALVAYAGLENSEMKEKAKSVTQITDSVYQVSDSLLDGKTIAGSVKKNYKVAKVTTENISTFLPIGWNLEAEKAVFISTRQKANDREVSMSGFWILKIFGLLITIFGVMLGAPFWFDVLGKVSNIRSSIKPAKPELDK